MRDVGVIAYVTPGALFQVLKPENKDERQICSAVYVFYGIAVLIGWIAFHEVGGSQFVFWIVAGFFFSIGYFTEKIVYPIMVVSPPFDEPSGTEDHM